ncbi:MAG TPA: chromate transporter, partial [bacterium]|nr:chromate transporter [bacterium]
MIYLNLFAAFFRIGLFAFGGAYSFLPLLEKEIVQKYQWLTKEEFLDVL